MKLGDRKQESLTDNEIISILEFLGCEKYKEYKNYISFSTSVCHNGSHLNLIYFRDSKYFRCFSGCKSQYNIFTLIQKNKNCSFIEALKFVSEFVNREYIQEEIDEKDIISDWEFIKKLKKKNRQNFEENRELPIGILNQYIVLPHQKWIDDGILPTTQIEWGVMYDLKTDRICYGLYTEDNKLVGVKGRSVYDDIEPKYLYLYSCEKSQLLVGLNKTLPYILSEKKCIVYESIKSCMLSWQYGYKFCVSIEGSSISDWQYEKLIRLDAEIILAFDKGVDAEDKQFYKKIINRLKSFTKVSVVYDKWDILSGEKSSPVDEGFEKFKILYDKRFRIN